jgi:hypothetical protein
MKWTTEVSDFYQEVKTMLQILAALVMDGMPSIAGRNSGASSLITDDF